MRVNSLRLQLRFLVPLALILIAAIYLALPLMEELTLRWSARDLNSRGAVVASTLSNSIAESLRNADDTQLQALLQRTVQKERLVAIALCSLDGRMLQRTTAFPPWLDCAQAEQTARNGDAALQIEGGPVHVDVQPVSADAGPIADIVLLHDLSFIQRRSKETRRYLVLLIAVLGVVIAAATVVVAQISLRGWIAGVRGLLRGGTLNKPASAAAPELEPIADELRARLRDLDDAYRRIQGPPAEWTPERLRLLLNTQLSGDQVIVVANREPYIHEHTPGGVVVRRPASGLVTAIEPVMRACSGTWIAHGSGNADRDVVDEHDRVMVPPGRPEYTLRRLWLTEEEEKGYYYGFANEGLWPLCHVAHVRPVFRESDWHYYRLINQRFADAVVAEARSEDPVVLVQDYHFALLPAMVRAQLPRATILTFWHIPWPNPESFGICPWKNELLEGMLGSSILGFHTPFHCKNFIETVERYLEARIEHEHSMITFHDDDTFVESYPISIAWPTPETVDSWPSVEQCRANVFERFHLAPETRLAVGVDRFDYTKGILERLNAVERMLEKHPAWVGRFAFIQVAAPSRSSLQEYRLFQIRIQEVTERINQRFGTESTQPVYLVVEHHEHDQLIELYRAADVCVVTSLHDGMNLVSKEFVASRDDERGALILSRFAGAARELPDALIVNPYHVEETADALHHAITMPAAEQRERMASMRMTVRESNIYRWAGRMLLDASRWRLRERIEARVRRHQRAT